MRITADTNILISSSFWYGASDLILKKVENKEVKLIISKDIINEFIDVLNSKEIQDKIKDKNLEIKRAISKIVSMSEMIYPSKNIEIIKEDISDNKILECALEGKVDYIITYDKHLLKLKEFGSIKIITPEEFLEKLKIK